MVSFGLRFLFLSYRKLRALHSFMSKQDNVFVQLVCSIQYRIVKENADDAFYELANPREQIQAYVFDGNP